MQHHADQFAQVCALQRAAVAVDVERRDRSLGFRPNRILQLREEQAQTESVVVRGDLHFGVENPVHHDRMIDAV